MNLIEVDKNLVKMLLANEIDILIHGCSCESGLPIGLGQQIEITFPEAKVAHYRFQARNRKIGMLGNFSEIMYKKEGRKFGVINLYVQKHPGPNLSEINMRAGLISVITRYGFRKRGGKPIRYGIPVIGSEWRSLTNEEMINHLKVVEAHFQKHDQDTSDLTVFLKTD